MLLVATTEPYSENVCLRASEPLGGRAPGSIMSGGFQNPDLRLGGLPVVCGEPAEASRM
jgi:hypothetical protein